VHDLQIQSQRLSKELARERARSAQLLDRKATSAALRGSKLGDASQTSVLAFVAVLSHPTSAALREALRRSWFPGGEHRRHFERDLGLVFRFVVERHNAVSQAVSAEAEKYGDVIIVESSEQSNTASKVLLAMEAAAATYGDARFFMRAADNVYLDPGALASLLSGRLHHVNSGYVGCQQRPGGTSTQFADPSDLDVSAPSFFSGSYVLSMDLVRTLVNSAHALKRGPDEGVMVGSWLFAFEHDTISSSSFCCSSCGGEEAETCIVVTQPQCNGVCNPLTTIPALHAVCGSGAGGPAVQQKSEKVLKDAAAMDAARRRDDVAPLQRPSG
jgi:hypothetical protein